MSPSRTDAPRRLREMTGAPVVECRLALAESGGDEDAARARLRDLAIERITTDVGCTTEQARAGHVRFGWDLARASDHARRQMLEGDPALAARQRRSWQLGALQSASCCAHLMPIVYEADLQTPLAASIGAVAELEALLRDPTGTDLGHAFDYADWMASMLSCIDAIGTADAIELVEVIRGGTSDCIGRLLIDFTAAHACLGTLYARLRDELQRVLEIDNPDDLPPRL